MKLKISDPVHYFYSRLLDLELDLDPKLRDHLIYVTRPFLRRTQPAPTFENRVLIAEGLEAYLQARRVAVKLHTLEVTDDRFEEMGRAWRGFVEALAKVFRIKGMRTPGPRAKPKKDLTPLVDSAADMALRAREEEPEVIGAEA